jgi:hypothetical protein
VREEVLQLGVVVFFHNMVKQGTVSFLHNDFCCWWRVAVDHCSLSYSCLLSLNMGKHGCQRL